MRYFNTTGPCNPQEHYTVLRKALIERGMDKVMKGRYFTLFAPRQAGKTTFFQLLLEELRNEGTFTPIWISFENLKTVSREEFYQVLARRVGQELATYGIKRDLTFKNQIDFESFFEGLIEQDRRIVLVIDEFEGVPERVLSELMHTFRGMYHKKQNHGLHSLILVGVSTLAELVVSYASPFNIVDQLLISYFTREEVEELIAQYVSETGQSFDEEVIRTIYLDTKGQPGLVCALCQHLVEEVATEKSKPVTMNDYYATQSHFLTERFDKNILNIVQKAREKKTFMLRLLFSDQPIPFTVDEPEIAYLFAHGVIENVNGWVEVSVPLYKKRLLTAFRPKFNGESDHYVSAYDDFSEYATPEGLNLKALLQRYVAYVAKRGFQAFDTKHLREGAWHYSLDGFIIFFVEQFGGQTFVEVPSGRGRTDILILFRGRKYLIETKRFTTQTYFRQGKQQLVEYLKSEGLEEGYYVVFSQKHSADDELYQEEIIEGKRVHTYLIRVNFERPSKARKKRATK